MTTAAERVTETNALLQEIVAKLSSCFQADQEIVNTINTNFQQAAEIYSRDEVVLNSALNSFELVVIVTINTTPDEISKGRELVQNLKQEQEAFQLATQTATRAKEEQCVSQTIF